MKTFFLIIGYLLILLACCCTDADAAEKGKVELVKTVLEIIYVGDPPNSVKEAVVRALFPEKSLVVELKEVYIPVKHESVKKEPEKKSD